MKRKEFERVTPEAAGIPSGTIMDILDRLEDADYCEPHGLVIMRHGKILAEGWWNPYGKNVPHELFSMTKSYTATALGIAYTEGLIDLNAPVLDYYPEYRECNTDPKAQRIRVKDVLTMSSGKPEVRCSSTDWIRHFFKMKSEYEPGSVYAYSCEDTHCVEALVQRVTGRSMEEYLKEKLFDKLGIDINRLKWAYLPDGSVIGCGGLLATTEDSARLVKLYLEDGVWDGERLLARDYVELATHTQILQPPEEKHNTEFSEEGVLPGYGYQIWTNLTKIEGTFAFCGAIGQYGVGIPEKDIVISLHESSEGMGTNRSISMITSLLKHTAQSAPLPDDLNLSSKLAERLARLSLGRPCSQPYSKVAEEVNGQTYIIEEGCFTFPKNLWNHIADCVNIEKIVGISQFSFQFDNVDTCIMTLQERGRERRIIIGLDGCRRENTYGCQNMEYVDRAVFDGAWTNENVFQVNARWIQTSFSISAAFIFEMDGVRITAVNVYGDFDAHPLRHGDVIAKRRKKE